MSKQGIGRYFSFIKNKVSSDWKDLAWHLGFETPDIDNIHGKHWDDKSRCMDLLQQWYKQKGNAATIHVLMEALQDAELQHVVDSLKDKYTDPLQPTASKQAGNTDALREEVKMLKEKNDKLEKIILEQNEKIQQNQETIKNMEARIEELLTAKQPVQSESQQKDLLQPMSDKHSMEKSKATNTGQVKQSVVQPQRQDIGPSVRSIRKGRPWVRKVSFGGEGSLRGKFKCPRGVAVSQDNEVYITDVNNSRIQVFTMDGVYIREFPTTLPGETGEKFEPQDVAVDRNDNLWVVGYDHVVQYSRKGTCLVKIDLPHVGYFRGITVATATEHCQVIVTEYDGQNGRLRVFNQDGSDVRIIYRSGHRSPEPWHPRYVTVDGDGNILIGDVKNHCVQVLDREGNFKFMFECNPQGICVDVKGNIIVADYENGCVKMFDSLGRFLCHIGSGMKKPWTVAVSPGGDVVVTDWVDNTVSVWTQG